MRSPFAWLTLLLIVRQGACFKLGESRRACVERLARVVSAGGAGVVAVGANPGAFRVARADDALIGTTDFEEKEVRDTYKKAKAAETGTPPDFDRGYKLYSLVTDAAPENVLAWAGLGNCAVALQKLDEALEAYGNAIDLSDGRFPSSTWMVHLNRGAVLLSMGEQEKALADLDTAAAQGPQVGDGRLLLLENRGLVLERLGRYEDAVSDFERAVGAKPGDIQPWWERYALCLLETGRDLDAQSIGRRTKAKFEGAAEARAALAAIEAATGNRQNAIASWASLQGPDAKQYKDRAYLEGTLHWPPRAVEGALRASALLAEDQQARESLQR